MGATVFDAAAGARSADYASPGGFITGGSKRVPAVRGTAVWCPVDTRIGTRCSSKLYALPRA